jgi:hypothetical protein
MDELTKARFREHGDALETVTKFANSTADDVARLENELSKLKVWAATMMKAQIEAAATELRNEISDVLSAAHETARTRAEEATKTLHDLETLMSAGPAKTIRVVRDGEGAIVGGLVHEIH